MTQEQTSGAGGQTTCAHCGRSMPTAGRFCPHCGYGAQTDAKTCGSCGASISGDPEFCPSCGATTGPRTSPPTPIATGQGRTDHIKYRNMIVQVILAIVTLGIYTIYWYYVTLDELHKANGKIAGAGMWTVLSVIPIASLFAQWHHASEYAEFVDGKYPGIAIFILWIVFSPAVWFLVQMDLNRAAGQQS